MFELSVAGKYLLPRRRQLSASVISVVSILVISLVTCLVLVFFSVTQGLEKSWIEKLIALTAPVRITPTEAYRESYYYRIDSISQASDYQYKSIGEKRLANTWNPHNPDLDSEIPSSWPSPENKDLVQLCFSAIEDLNLNATDYELAVGNLKLQLKRPSHGSYTHINQSSYLHSFDGKNPYLGKALLPLTGDDIENLLVLKGESVLEHVQITTVRTGKRGWRMPPSFFPQTESARFLAIMSGDKPVRYLLAKNLNQAQRELENSGYSIKAVHQAFSALDAPMYVAQDILFQVERQEGQNLFIETDIQGISLKGNCSLRDMKIASFQKKTREGPWVQKDDTFILPEGGVLVAKHLRASGVRVGDAGYVSYQTPTVSGLQEQRSPVYVAGFYDPGIIPVGGKFVLTDPELITTVRSAYQQSSNLESNGINVWTENLDDVDGIAQKLKDALTELGIAPYWKVETYKEYPFTKELIQQLASEKNLFSVIALIIIIVACTNIITMLLLLVNDKRMEIAILRTMGASAFSIAQIFGICGLVMGTLGTALGTVFALFILRNLDPLLAFVGQIQGHDVFSSTYYGEIMPNSLSTEAWLLVLLSTAIVSLLSGLVPAIKACYLRPADVFRSE